MIFKRLMQSSVISMSISWIPNKDTLRGCYMTLGSRSSKMDNEISPYPMRPLPELLSQGGGNAKIIRKYVREEGRSGG